MCLSEILCFSRSYLLEPTGWKEWFKAEVWFVADWHLLETVGKRWKKISMWNMGLNIRWSLLLYKKINLKKQMERETSDWSKGWARFKVIEITPLIHTGHWMIRCCLGPDIWCTGCYTWVDTKEWCYTLWLSSVSTQIKFFEIQYLFCCPLYWSTIPQNPQILSVALFSRLSLLFRALLLQLTLHWVDWSCFLLPLGLDLISDTHSGLCLLQNILHF